MATQSEVYLAKAEEFEERARAAPDADTTAAYAELGENYRRLASHLQASAYGKPQQTWTN